LIEFFVTKKQNHGATTTLLIYVAQTDKNTTWTHRNS